MILVCRLFNRQTKFGFFHDGMPFLALILKTADRGAQEQVGAPAGTQSGRTDYNKEPWRALLQESDMGFFNILREWRSKRAKKDGMPPYVVFTNQQLAEIIKTRPQNLADLGKIDGVGKAKSDRYGEEILALTKIPSPTTEPVPTVTTEEGPDGTK
jgi:superfamily II DNA helicase RecQ